VLVRYAQRRTPACVSTRGHQPRHVVSDATSSRTQDNWRVALKRMRQAGVVITSTEMVIYELLQRAGSDEFRAVLPLVK